MRRIVCSISADHVISSTTGTEVTRSATDLRPFGGELGPGTYVFDYYVIVQTATGSVGVYLGVNFTGTAATRNIWADWTDVTTAVTDQTFQMDDVSAGTSFGFADRIAQNAFSTTAANMGSTVGGIPNVNILMKLTGILVVTVAGRLELWHRSETATSTTVKAGSSVIIQQTA